MVDFLLSHCVALISQLSEVRLVLFPCTVCWGSNPGSVELSWRSLQRFLSSCIVQTQNNLGWLCPTSGFKQGQLQSQIRLLKKQYKTQNQSDIVFSSQWAVQKEGHCWCSFSNNWKLAWRLKMLEPTVNTYCHGLLKPKLQRLPQSFSMRGFFS